MQFYKYQGTGNDFVIIDNRQTNERHLSQQKIESICNRRFGIGADGLMLLNQKPGYDFEMVYYNADGNEGSMCGNGGRCIVQFAHDMGIIKNDYSFIAVDGLHEAYIKDNLVSLKMSDVSSIQQFENHFVLNTGSPHYVKKVKAIADMDVYTEGKKIRYSNEFKQDGINVNFVELLPNGALKVRTYERGVENETFSCGTGVTAAALVFHQQQTGANSIDIEVLGGQLNVSYNKNADGSFDHIWLTGPAKKVFEGNIESIKSE